jgi:hypothetical protein
MCFGNNGPGHVVPAQNDSFAVLQKIEIQSIVDI